MLHILLVILKIIGIIFAVILGLILLLLAILLCVPVRYYAEGSVPKDIKKSTARGHVTWLLHLIRVDIAFEDQKLIWKIRIAWKTLKNEEERKQTDEKEDGRNETRKKQKDIQQKTQKETQKVEGTPKFAKVEEEHAPKEELLESHEKVKENAKDRMEKRKEKSAESETNIREKHTEKSAEPEQPHKTGRFEKIKCTISNFCAKIKHTVSHAEETIEDLTDKKDRIVKELEDPVHQKAFSKVKKELWKLCMRWKPKVLKGKIHFGFEDPYHTGQALAFLSVIYPFIGGCLFVDPDFEQRILEGSVKIKGRFCMMPLVCLLWNLVWCKEIRRTYHDIRNFKF